MEKNKNIRIELPKASVVKIYLPILFFLAGGVILYSSKGNKMYLLLFAVAVGLGLRSIKDLISAENRGNRYYNEVISNMGVAKNSETLNALKEGLEIDKTNAYINYGLVMINYQNKNYKEVIKYIDNIDLKRVKKNSVLILDKEVINSLKGTSLYEIKDYKGAIELLEPIIESNNIYKIIVALSYRELGDIEKSLSILELGTIEGSRIDDEIAFDYWKGINLLDLDRKDEAREMFVKVSAIDKNYADTKKYMAKLK